MHQSIKIRLWWHFTPHYRHQAQIQCIPSCGNHRKPLTSSVQQTTHSWIFSALLPLFFRNCACWFFSGSKKWIQLSSPVIICSSKSFSSSLYWVSKLSATPVQFFRCSPISCRGTQPAQMFCNSGYCNARSIVASPDLCEKHVVISHRMSVIVKGQLSLTRICTQCTVLSNIMLSCPLCLSSCMFGLPSRNIYCHQWTFLKFIIFFFLLLCTNGNEFWLSNYFLLLKTEQHFATYNRRG